MFILTIRFRRYKNGIALATSIMLSLIILVLGTALLTSSQRDLYFQVKKDARDKAEVLARSGLEHAHFLAAQPDGLLESTLGTNKSVDYSINSDEYFVLERRRDRSTGRYSLIVTGEVRRGSKVLASRTLVVPFGVDNFLQPNDIATSVYAK